MFNPKTQRIQGLSEKYNSVIRQVGLFFKGKVNIYIDYANVRPWATKLRWNIDLKRLRQFLESFNNVNSIKIYDGTLVGDIKSEEKSEMMQKIFKKGFITKPVKIMKQSIDYSSIPNDSTSLLEKFIRRCLLRKYDIETIEYLNSRFREMNQKGVYCIEDLKCNFDVEIGRDMLLDFEREGVDTYILWSGDSDFYEPIKQLLNDGKRVMLFATARKVSKELNSLQEFGLEIFDIQKIREFICWKKQINMPKGPQDGALKL